MFSNIIGTFSAQVPALVISILSGVFLTRILGPDGKGIYAIYFANIELVVLFLLFGIDLAIVYFGANRKIEFNKLQGIATYLLIFIVPLLLLLSTLKTDLVFPSEADSFYYRAIFIVLIFFSMLNTLIGAFFKSKKKFKFINRVSLINSALNLTIFFSLFVYAKNNESFELGFSHIFFITLIINLINTLISIYFFQKNIKYTPDFKVGFHRDLKPLIVYLFPVFAGVLINFFNYRVDVWFVYNFEGEVELGYYALAVNLAQFILLYVRIIGTVIMPYLSNASNEVRVKYFLSYSRFIFLSVVFFIAILTLIGQFLVPMMYGESFTSSVLIFKILLIGMLFTSLNQIYSIYLFSKAKNNVTLLSNSIGLVITILFDILLIPAYGIKGAAVATDLSYFSIFVVLYIYIVSREKISLLSLFKFNKEDFKLILKK